MKKAMFIAVMIFLAMTVTAYAVVTPTLNIQGTHGSYIWSTEYSAPSISIGMQTDESDLADWWLLCLTPSGWKYYHPTYQYWFDGCYPVRQGSLYSFEQTVIPTAGLDFTQSGSYLFFFGTDKTMNGQVDTENLVYDIQSVNVFPVGKTAMVTIFDSFQVMIFNKLSDGSIYGFSFDNDSSPIEPSRIKKVKEVSDRVGWTGNSVASVDYNSDMATIIIPNTANNDKSEWVLELESGDFAWADPAWLAIAGKAVIWNSVDGLFEYNDYRKQTIYFANGQAYIDFACNLTGGMVSHVNPNDIAYVRWTSDSTGGNNLATATGKLSVDTSGNYYAQFLSGVVGSGLFSAVFEDGSAVWFNIDSWDYSGAKIVGGRIIVN